MNGTPVSSVRRVVTSARVVGMRVDAGADRGGAEVDLADQARRLGEALLVLAEHHRVGGELLAERHRHRVLQLRAADLEDVAELGGLGFEGFAQHHHVLQQPVDAEVQRELDRGRIDVVGALRKVDVVERMQVLVLALRVPEQLERAVADHLVGVHVGRGAGAALDHVDHELLEQLALAHLLAGEADRRARGARRAGRARVGDRGGLLDAGERHHQVGVDRDRRAGDREVLQRAQRVHAVVRVGGHRAVAEQVVFDPHRLRHGGILALSCVFED